MRSVSAIDPSPIQRDEVRAVARLANLDLSPDEEASMTAELGEILAYVRKLEELDVSEVPPTAHMRVERLPLREDVPHESLPRELALREAPKVAHDGFAVPAFVEES